MQRIIVIITVVQVVSVPLLAFLIRMAFGETRTPEEKVVSDALRMGLTRLGIPMERYGTD